MHSDKALYYDCDKVSH